MKMEDSHYCLKCGATVVGLDNYINHRKTPCDVLPVSSKIYDDFGATTSAAEHAMNVKPDVAVSDPKVGDSRRMEQDKKIDAEAVEADNFFSSLELQSSSKTTTAAGSVNQPGKPPSGIVTRSKSLIPAYSDISKISEKSEASSSVGKARKPRTTTRKKKTRKKTIGKPRKAPTRERKESSGSQKRLSVCSVRAEDDRGASPGALDRNRYDDEWNLFSHLVVKKASEESKKPSEPPGSIRRYTPELFSMSPILMTDELSEEKEAEVDKFLEDEDYDDEAYLNLEDVDEFNYAPPRHHTGGKWKPGSLPVRTSPVLWTSQTWDNLLDEDGRIPSEELSTDMIGKGMASFTGGKWKSYAPPSTYTGGKWKPCEAPQPIKKVTSEVPPASYTGGKWHPGKRVPSEPPATHTGGKWKPSQISPSHQGKSWKNDVVSSDLNPSSDHSHGKWVPSKNSVDNKTLNVIASCQSTSGKCLKTSGGLIQYYCSPCNRRLASKKMYKKHVMSELHLKRVLQENELEFDSRSIKIFRGLFSVMNNEQRGPGKRPIKKPEFFKDMEMGIVKRVPKDVAKMKRKRLSRKEFIRCNICKTKLFSHQLGKHLVSYYHSRRIRLDDPEQQKLVLDNIHAIVKQAPYQCGVCKFYFNNHTQFKKHWMSPEHKWMEETDGRKFWCVLCNFECDTSRSMELHLDSNSHREVIMAVNKSIPIIIRQKQIFNCRFCDKEFRYNFALIRHNRISHGHAEAESLKVYPCAQCKYKSRTVKSLQRHVIRRHKGTAEVPYFCSACDLYFHTADEAKNHRKSQSHRSKKPSLTRLCPHCREALDDLEKLKAHIVNVHPTLRPNCSRCGRIFTLPQELSQHNKENSCTFLSRPDEKTLTGAHCCRLCGYSSSLKADLLHHQVLHDKSTTDLERLACPLCGKTFRVLALKVHLRTHTNEKPHECKRCGKTFVRRSRLVAHIKFEHGQAEKQDGKKFAEEVEDFGLMAEGSESVEKKRKIDIKLATDGPKCGDSRCKYAAKDAEDAEHHARVHIGRNIFQCPSCNYQAKTNTLLKRHNKIHLDERSHACPHCPFRGRLASHLKRHLRLHTGAKPYKCPHCPYQCNILENLRKHVLFTRIHPGKKLYECKMCSFATNESKAFKQHLQSDHRDKFQSDVAITAYVAGIYSLEEDVQAAVTPVPVRRKVAPPQSKRDRATMLKNVAILTKKYEPIAPKPEEPRKATPAPGKTLANSVLDKRKVLEMELAKLKNQVKKKTEQVIRSYPSPTILKAEKAAKALSGRTTGQNRLTERRDSDSAIVNPKVEVQSEAVAEDEESPSTYVLFGSGITFEGNDEHLTEEGFYLLENYND